METESLTKIRHTLAHLLACAVHELYPHAKATIGPAIESGFYYDFDFGTGEKPGDQDLPNIEKKMRELLKRWERIEGVPMHEEEARAAYEKNPYKLELIEEIVERKEPITFYHTMKGEDSLFRDLCRGGHVEKPALEIPAHAFSLDRIAGAYWRGDETRPMLTRIYGLAFATKDELDAYRTAREEARKRDHKKLGKELDLFYIDELIGKGLPLWTPKGTALKHELERYTRDLEKRYGYEHVATPYLANKKLYELSGHLAHYQENMYAPIAMDDELFYLRPMACPHHIRLLQRKPLSYRDLPVRYAELADYNRYEKSGELMGLIRVRKFQLTDAHIFVTREQLKDEFVQVCKMIQEGIAGLGLQEIVSYRFSKRDPENTEKYYPDDELWHTAEGVMKEALDATGLPYTEALDEAAFYGPKLDVQAKNVNGKEDTLFTAQMDFLLPEKFSIEYVAEDGTKKRPVMIHRSAIGALERTVAFLIEHYGGAFPFWMSPVQARILPIGEAHRAYAQEVRDILRAHDIRVDVDAGDLSLGKRIREARLEKLPLFIVIGNDEVEKKSVTLEWRDGTKEVVELSLLASRLHDRIQSRS